MDSTLAAAVAEIRSLERRHRRALGAVAEIAAAVDDVAREPIDTIERIVAVIERLRADLDTPDLARLLDAYSTLRRCDR